MGATTKSHKKGENKSGEASPWISQEVLRTSLDVGWCNKGITVFKIFIGKVYCRLYGRNFSFTATHERGEYGYPHLNALLQFHFKLERCKPHKITRHPTKCGVFNDVKLFMTVYRRVYCRHF